MAKYKSIIGRAEEINLPDLLLPNIPAKIDTGAFTSSIHAINIRETKRNNKKVLKFRLFDGHPAYNFARDVELQRYSTTVVENSFGHSQERYQIELKVKMAGKVFKAPFTLADRSNKTFPVLIGRTFLNKRFIVDTSIVHVDRKKLKLLFKDTQKELEEDME